MKLVVIESPVAATDVFTMAQHYRYFQMCCADAFLEHDEFPYGSHWIAQGILDDTNPLHRHMGIACGLKWAAHAEYAVVYKDLGISRGMSEAIKHWKATGKPVIERTLGWDVVKAIHDMDDASDSREYPEPHLTEFA